jgi:hypothetical protein
MDMLQRQVLVALASITMIVIVRVPEMGSHEMMERHRGILIGSQLFVQLKVPECCREFAQLAKVRSGQETAEQKIKRHKLSNDFHGDDLKYPPKVVLVFCK